MRCAPLMNSTFEWIPYFFCSCISASCSRSSLLSRGSSHIIKKRKVRRSWSRSRTWSHRFVYVSLWTTMSGFKSLGDDIKYPQPSARSSPSIVVVCVNKAVYAKQELQAAEGLEYWLTYWTAEGLEYWLPYWTAEGLEYWLTYWTAEGLEYWLPYWTAEGLDYWLPYWTAEELEYWLTYWLIFSNFNSELPHKNFLRGCCRDQVTWLNFLWIVPCEP